MKITIRTLPNLILLILLIASCDGVNNESENRVYIGNNYKGVQSNEARSFLELGDEKVNNRQYEKALKYFEKANNAEPNNALILNSIANTEFFLERVELAYSFFQKAIDLDSSYLISYASYGTCLEKDKRYKEAIKILTVGFEKATPNEFVYYVLSFNLSIVYYKIGNCKNAKKCVDIAINNKFKNENFDKETKKIAEVINSNCPI